jgi:hypothetical protein
MSLVNLGASAALPARIAAESFKRVVHKFEHGWRLQAVALSASAVEEVQQERRPLLRMRLQVGLPPMETTRASTQKDSESSKWGSSSWA